MMSNVWSCTQAHSYTRVITHTHTHTHTHTRTHTHTHTHTLSNVPLLNTERQVSIYIWCCEVSVESLKVGEPQEMYELMATDSTASLTALHRGQHCIVDSTASLTALHRNLFSPRQRFCTKSWPCQLSQSRFLCQSPTLPEVPSIAPQEELQSAKRESPVCDSVRCLSQI
jgi:hypothetical protein